MKLIQLSLIALCAGVASASNNNAKLKSAVQQRLQARQLEQGIFDAENFGLDFTDGIGGFAKSLGKSVAEVASVPVKAVVEGYNWLGETSPIGCSKAGRTCDSVLYNNALYSCEGHYAKCWKGCCCEDKKLACAVIGHIPDVIPAVAALVGYCAATYGGCVIAGQGIMAPEWAVAAANAETVIGSHAPTIISVAPNMDWLYASTSSLGSTIGSVFLEEQSQQKLRGGNKLQVFGSKSPSKEELSKIQKAVDVLSFPNLSEEELEPVIKGAAKSLGVSVEKVKEVVRFVISSAAEKKVCARECRANDKCVLKEDPANHFTTRTPCSFSNCCSK